MAERHKASNIELRTQVGKTTMVGILKRRLPGPAIALHTDMDGLPVKQMTEPPFPRQATGIRLGKIGDGALPWPFSSQCFNQI